MTGILAAVVLELMRESLTGTHCRYREVGSPEYVSLDCGSAAAALESGGVAAALLDRQGRVLRRVIRDNVAYDYDGATLVRTIPLWYNAKPARVFDPNPIVATNDPSLRDRNDAASAVPESAYTHVEIPDSSPHVKIVDVQAPFIAPVDSGVFDRAQDGFEDISAIFHIDRTQRYLQSLGYTGAKQIAPYAVETDTHAAGGLDNSFFLPSSTQAGRGTLFFGTGGTDDAEDADLVVHEYAHALHEWIAPGTFLGTVASQSRAIGEGFGDYWAFSNHVAQRRASGRDPFCFADWDARCAGDDPAEQCGYAAGADCLRRLDTGRTMADYDRGDTAGTEHRNSAIWSGALISLFETIGKRTTDILVVESLFGAPSNPTFATMAQRMVNADRLLFGGAHIGAICAAMSARGIVTGADCGTTPRGELTWLQSGDRSLPIPENNTEGVSSRIVVSDTRAIERVLVRVDIAHPSRGDLRITLTSPDGTRVILQQVSFDRTRDLHATFGLDATPFESLDAFHGRSASGTWTLNVADMRALDAGTLESWGPVFQFAGDVPAAQRPAVSSAAQILPVVAHAAGANGAFFRTDLFLSSDVTRTATLIFTPSERDGRTTFSSAKVLVPANRIVALRDVLPAVLMTSGSGSLVVDGGVRVSARIHTDGVGHAVEPFDVRSRATRIYTPRFFERVNVGIAEAAGVEAVVDVAIDDVVIRKIVPPHSHVQFTIPPETKTLDIRSSTDIAAYAAIVDSATNDSLYLPADARGTEVAPGIRAAGANGTSWQTDALGLGDITIVDLDGNERSWSASDVTFDLLGTKFGNFAVIRLSPAMQIVIRESGHRTALVPRGGQGTLFPIEQSSRFRTNLTLTADTATVARVSIYDAAGRPVLTFERPLRRNELVQGSVGFAIVDGRIVVEGEGVHAWASVIDNATGDATIFGAR